VMARRGWLAGFARPELLQETATRLYLLQ